MHTMDSAQKQDAVNTLRSLGVDLDESKATQLLERHNWDLDAAGSALFTELETPAVPAVQYHNPLPKVPNAIPVPATGTRSKSPYGGRDMGDVDSRGALNASTRVTIKPSGLEDLMDIDDEVYKNIDMPNLPSNESNPRRANTPAAVTYGPKNRGEENQAIVPSQPMMNHTGVTQEEQALSQALEASLTTSLQADVYTITEPDQRLRKPGFPIALRSRDLTHVTTANILQALFAVPQILERLSKWRDDSVDTVRGPRKSLSRNVLHMQELYTLMDLYQESEFNIDEVAKVLELPPSPPHGPNYEVIHELLTNNIAFSIDTVLLRSSGIPIDVDPSPSQRLLLFRGGMIHEVYEPRTYSYRIDSAVLGLQAVTTDDLVNSLDSALFSLLLQPPVPSFFSATSATICFSISRPDTPTWSNAVKTPFSYPARLLLDPYMIENVDLVQQKKDERDHAMQIVDTLEKRKEAILRHDGKDTMMDLKKTIHYLENVAGGRELPDTPRAQQLKSMVVKLKGVLAHCEAEVKNINSQIKNLQNASAGMFDDLELQNHPYDLRAVLVHDGFVGREHNYVYLRSPTSGKWFKSCDAMVTEVTEDAVLNDSSGLHLNAGPYLLVYSRAMDHPIPSPLPWPFAAADTIAQMNESFIESLSPELRQTLRLEAIPGIATPGLDTSGASSTVTTPESEGVQ